MRKVTRLLPVLAASAVLALCGRAGAQPLQLPGAQPFNAPGTQQVLPPTPGAPAAPRQPSMPAIKVPAEQDILGKALHRNGNHGSATLTKLGTGYGLKLDLDGFQPPNLTEPCAVSFGEAPVPVTALGRPAGVPRYRLEAPICPIVFDILDGAFLVVEPNEHCVVQAAQCRIDPRGLWGADARTIAAQAKEIERARGAAERAVREGYRTLTAKANAVDQRGIAREQAGFSGERETTCRDYQREAQYGFCTARLTEARAADLRARLGLDTTPKPASKPKPRPPKPAPLPLAPSE
ncbi:hypothetical protein [Bosea sp. (in: a-proteobacteria)]|uniref:LptM family lipoprotein n=1 Tax=Bosea sp. (in: a-proteobacteria) TaxID=1871050 RepID=UPI00121C49E8|nr:hypothetical protein [Bosea sp. (in: a-proteobacteria)]TAJ33556.1 MAG: hypothetical protein EPO59_04825 [Bosea sp. (in: a-proteobacteria)]